MHMTSMFDDESSGGQDGVKDHDTCCNVDNYALITGKQSEHSPDSRFRMYEWTGYNN